MRNKQKGIETISVMLLLVLFAFVVFMVIEAGTNAFGSITDDKQATMSARVAFSYISMKVKQNDVNGAVSVQETKFGDTLKIDTERFSTYIFFYDGGLYECFTWLDKDPSIEAANKITSLSSFSLSEENGSLKIGCIYKQEDKELTIEGTVGIRS